MNNNDILRRIRYTFDFSDLRIIDIFELGNCAVTRTEMSDWLKKDDDPAFKPLNDVQLAMFLNGLITARRGKKDGPPVEPEKRLTNNAILWKLRIALDFKAADMIKVMQEAGFPISDHELSAFFRKPTHKHFRECKDQFLRNFLSGLQKKHRGSW